MIDGEWYQTVIMAPPLNVVVRVLDAGDVFTACRILQKKGRLVWGRKRAKGRLQVMPARWMPELWQPINRATWDAPLPDPAPPAFLEAYRYDPHRKHKAADPDLARDQWWRDEHQVGYPKGTQTPRVVEGRLMRSMMTARSIRMDDPRGPGSNSAWIARQIERVEMEMGLRSRPTHWSDKFKPTPKDVSDFGLIAEQKWLMGVTGQELLILHMRSDIPAWSWRQIGAEIGEEPDRVQELYRGIIVKVTRRANDAVIYGQAA